MFIFQTAYKPREETVSSRRAAQKKVTGWFSALRGRVMSVMRKLFS